MPITPATLLPITMESTNLIITVMAETPVTLAFPSNSPTPQVGRDYNPGDHRCGEEGCYPGVPGHNTSDTGNSMAPMTTKANAVIAKTLVTSLTESEESEKC